MPHNPTTTLGTAASISISVPTGPRTDGGASSLRKSPIAIDRGAARSIAPSEVITVPMIRSRAPKRLVTGFHSLCHRKPRWNTLTAGQAPSATRQTIAATTRSPRNDAAAVSPYRRPSPSLSPRLRVRANMAAVAVTAPACRAYATRERPFTRPSQDRHGFASHARSTRRDTRLVSATHIEVRSGTDVVRTTDPVFEIEGLTVAYGKSVAIRDVGIDIYRNAITAIIGPSGCGKSTFLRCLNRMNDLVPSVSVDGEGRYHGIDLYGPDVDPIEVRRRIGMVFQRPNPFPKSIYDNVAYGLRILGMKDDLDGRVERALRHAALWDEVKGRLKKSALGLSGGQQQRLCIARAIAVEPDVVLLDEPASALDPISTTAIEDLMHELKRDYTLVIVTHNMQQAARVAEMTAFFSLDVRDDGSRNGILVEYDSTEKIFTQPADERTEGYVTGRFG